MCLVYNVILTCGYYITFWIIQTILVTLFCFATLIEHQSNTHRNIISKRRERGPLSVCFCANDSTSMHHDIITFS